MKKVFGLFFLVLGLWVAIASLNPIYMLNREDRIAKSLSKHYAIDKLDMIENRGQLNGNEVEIVTKPSGDRYELQVLLNDTPLVERMNVPAHEDGNFYDGVWIDVFRLHNNDERGHKQDQIAIVQTMPGEKTFHLFYISPDQQVTATSVDIDNHSDNYLDISLVKRSGYYEMGYKLAVVPVTANYLGYVFPWIFVLIGCIQTLIGVILLIKARAATKRQLATGTSASPCNTLNCSR
ncbi:hypothetical protein SAMN04487969_13654 [Paenibacillus algorifonticola]|uniref:Uncharacterized protein n=1 Tax=Paenibacillus algorifonticola TaxID=684063 RepID=A0A1I2IJP7_9BACL|nr:hypothetical protein [Paenibacillus algorifonticola]SFF41910.1 hypothetical protein SAMN04487969_13654 [Paenibacillus algorifonticola]